MPPSDAISLMKEKNTSNDAQQTLSTALPPGKRVDLDFYFKQFIQGLL